MSQVTAGRRDVAADGPPEQQPEEPTSPASGDQSSARTSRHRPGVWRALFVTVITLGVLVSVVGMVTTTSTA